LRTILVALMRLKVTSFIHVIYFLYVLSIYGIYLISGGFVYDDWSVITMSVSTNSVLDAYLNYFPNFTNRPFAPLYYALISRFGTNPFGYILLNCLLWCVAVLCVGKVVANIFGNYVQVIFIYLASIPLVSSTLIFSPGMQSLGSFSLLLWAISFLLLYRGITSLSYACIGLSLVFILAMLLSYEVCLPLLFLSIIQPLIVGDFDWRRKGDRNIFIVNFIGIGVIVLFVLAYQKVLVPMFFGDGENITRLRVNNLEGLTFILHMTKLLVTEEFPMLLRRGLSITRHSPVSIDTVIPLLLGCIGILLAFIDSHGRNVLRFKIYFLCLCACILGIVGVGLIHWGAAVGPSLFGYSNRGLGSLAILLPLLFAVMLGFLLNRNKIFNWFILLVSFGILSAQLSSFMLVRSNFIEVAKLQKILISDLNDSFKKYSDVNIPRIVLADIPEFLPSDFNGETIYSNEVHDWVMSLNLTYPGRYSNSATLTKKKICSTPKRAIIDGDMLVLVGPDISIPINNIWFYRYDISSSQSFLIPIKDSKALKSLFETEFDCSK
jgi:hypothetical protein